MKYARELFLNLNIINILLTNKLAIIILISFLVVILSSILFLFFPKRRKEKFEDIELEKNNKEKKERSMNEVKEDKLDLEAMLAKMEADLKEEQDEITSFEEEQEEKAIISYKELVDANKKSKDDIEVINTFDDNSSIIFNYNEEEPKNDETEIKNVPTNKFKHTDFISPVYGVVSNDVEYPTISGKKEDLSKYDYEGHDLEKTLNIKPLSDEIRKNAEFLRALKEFRNNL